MRAPKRVSSPTLQIVECRQEFCRGSEDVRTDHEVGGLDTVGFQEVVEERRRRRESDGLGEGQSVYGRGQRGETDPIVKREAERPVWRIPNVSVGAATIIRRADLC